MPGPRPIFELSPNEAVVAGELRISADSHFGEPPDLWEKRLPAKFRDQAPRFPNITLYETNHHLRAGAWDPHERLKDLALDGTSAEVIFPTLGHNAWRLDDRELEEACIRVYNDWTIEFCSVAPERFWGLAMISPWDIDKAIQEMERCKKEGLRGVEIPITTAEEIPYSSEHYEKFWDAAEALKMPVNMHINTGRAPRPPSGHLPYGVHKFHCMQALADLIGSQALERHPNLNVVIAESGSGWIPFFAQEYDYYEMSMGRSPLPRPPSEYVARQVYTTFIGDKVGGYMAADWGQDTFLWSSDYPHPACLWPHSGPAIAQDLGHLTPEIRTKIVRQTVANLYNDGELPPQADEVPSDVQSLESWNLSMRLTFSPQQLTPQVGSRQQ